MKNSAQMIAILCMFAYIIFLQQCKSGNNATSEIDMRPDTTIVIDTILPDPVIVQLPRQSIPAPTIIYIDSSKTIVAPANVDTTKHQIAKSYQDSIEDENLTLYYNYIVDGQLLFNNLDYKLKIPKTITKNITIKKPVPVPSHQILFNTGLGTDTKSFSSLTVGLQFISKKGWSVGYDYDVLENSHRVTMGIRLWRNK